jgi:hypothetical protein
MLLARFCCGTLLLCLLLNLLLQPLQGGGLLQAATELWREAGWRDGLMQRLQAAH